MGRAPPEDQSPEAIRAARANQGWRRSLRVGIGFIIAIMGAIAALYVIRYLG
jgi:hypothetical protein